MILRGMALWLAEPESPNSAPGGWGVVIQILLNDSLATEETITDGGGAWREQMEREYQESKIGC